MCRPRAPALGRGVPGILALPWPGRSASCPGPGRQAGTWPAWPGGAALPRSPRPFSMPPALPTLGAPHSAALSEPRVNTGPFIRLSEITLDVCPV